MRLVDAGKLSLETPMLELLDLDEEIRDAGASFDERQRQITVAMLLEHRGGWDRDQSFDPMFRSVRFARRARRPPPADTGSIIAAMLRHPLDFAPGERYAYSNYGYCLLGRIIERVAGESYESFVRREVLEPIGIRQMRLGRTRLAERAAGEVRYHHPGEGRSVFAEDLDQPCPHPYGAWYLEAMDAHGGWIASGVDLLRLAVAIDDPDRSPLLSRSSLERMSARPDGLAGHDEQGKPRDVWYALGWQVRDVGEGKFNRWHSGSLPGTLSILIRRSDGRNFAALLNTRHSPKTESLGGEVDRLMHRAAAEVETWPEIDRFGDPEFAAE